MNRIGGYIHPINIPDPKKLHCQRLMLAIGEYLNTNKSKG